MKEFIIKHPGTALVMFIIGAIVVDNAYANTTKLIHAAITTNKEARS